MPRPRIDLPDSEQIGGLGSPVWHARRIASASTFNDLAEGLFAYDLRGRVSTIRRCRGTHASR
jgi:hypothetical protein